MHWPRSFFICDNSDLYQIEEWVKENGDAFGDICGARSQSL
jgi:hypothetical protein